MGFWKKVGEKAKKTARETVKYAGKPYSNEEEKKIYESEFEKTRKSERTSYLRKSAREAGKRQARGRGPGIGPIGLNTDFFMQDNPFGPPTLGRTERKRSRSRKRK